MANLAEELNSQTAAFEVGRKSGHAQATTTSQSTAVNDGGKVSKGHRKGDQQP
jgi:hypothetical protein